MKVGQRIAVNDQALWNQCTVMNPKKLKHNFVQRLLGIDHRLHRNQCVVNSLDFENSKNS